jgi:uncharacterized repeat protein (TIGR04138 family)
MNQLGSTANLLERVRAQQARYDERAYLFVLASIEYVQGRLPARRHVSGRELSYACRDYALEQYGLLARTVLEYWGIRGTGDFGRIVYALVGAGLLVTRPGDREEDFHEVYRFDRAFDRGYVWQGIPGS